MQTFDHGARRAAPRGTRQPGLLPAILVAIALSAPVSTPSHDAGSLALRHSAAPAVGVAPDTPAAAPAAPALLVDYISDRWGVDGARATEF